MSNFSPENPNFLSFAKKELPMIPKTAFIPTSFTGIFLVPVKFGVIMRETGSNDAPPPKDGFEKKYNAGKKNNKNYSYPNKNSFFFIQ